MDKLTINVSKPYDVIIGNGILENISELSAQVINGKRALVVSGSNVAPLYGRRIADNLNAPLFIHKSGEENKNFNTLENLISFMAKEGLTREDCLVAVGGGTTGDLTGLAASLYMRGIKYVQIPTSLLAAVDSSVGGKTAVNITCGKNIVGTFWQPSLVVIDKQCFETLPIRIYNEGMAEVIKDSYILGEDLRNDCDMVLKCLSLKKRLVEKDEFDTGDRMILNFGHTLGHAIETLSGFSLLHGEAVAIGMAYMCKAFSSDYELMKEMLLSYDLPITTEYNMQDIISAAKLDKKGGLFAVPHCFGDVRVENIDICKLT